MLRISYAYISEFVILVEAMLNTMKEKKTILKHTESKPANPTSSEDNSESHDQNMLSSFSNFVLRPYMFLNAIIKSACCRTVSNFANLT